MLNKLVFIPLRSLLSMTASQVLSGVTCNHRCFELRGHLVYNFAKKFLDFIAKILPMANSNTVLVVN